MSSRDRLPFVLQLVLVVAVVAGFSAGAATQPAMGGWHADGIADIYTARETLESKPRNTWTVRGLREAGFRGCVPTEGDVVTFDHPPVSHVVRLPLAEGWRWVRMPAREVAARVEVFGGTPTVADDPVVVGNCY